MSVKVYCCGGAGTNIGLELMSVLDTAFWDSSKANFNAAKAEIPSAAYFLDGAKGSGSDQSQNYPLIMESLKAFLQKERPEEFNIVVFSTSGGTGAVMGRELINELMTQGKVAIGVMIAAEDTARATQNTLKTFKRLYEIQDEQAKPLPVMFQSNSEYDNTTEVDASICRSIQLIHALLGVPHDRLDQMDLYNWINYNAVSGVPNALVTIALAYDDDSLRDLNLNPVSVLSLFSNPGAKYKPELLDNAVAYQKSGYVEEFRLSEDERMTGEEVHYVIELDRIAQYEEHVIERLNEHRNVSQARMKRKSAFSKMADEDLDF